MVDDKSDECQRLSLRSVGELTSVYIGEYREGSLNR